MHVMIDEPNEDIDRAIANHIVAVHQLKREALAAPYSMEEMQRYIKYARAIKPEMTDEASRAFVFSGSQDRASSQQSTRRYRVRRAATWVTSIHETEVR